jgi:orotate phosphoribosyltransferase
LARFVPELARPLYQQVVDAKIEYDAITSCPRGGNAWAEALIAHAKTDGREVPFYKLNKVSTGTFSVIDGQPVKRGAKLLLADDTIYRGITSSAAVSVLEDAGFKIAGLVFPVEIGLQGRRHWDKKGYPVFSIYNNSFIEALSRS